MSMSSGCGPRPRGGFSRVPVRGQCGPARSILPGRAPRGPRTHEAGGRRALTWRPGLLGRHSTRPHPPAARLLGPAAAWLRGAGAARLPPRHPHPHLRGPRGFRWIPRSYRRPRGLRGSPTPLLGSPDSFPSLPQPPPSPPEPPPPAGERLPGPAPHVPASSQGARPLDLSAGSNPLGDLPAHLSDDPWEAAWPPGEPTLPSRRRRRRVSVQVAGRFVRSGRPLSGRDPQDGSAGHGAGGAAAAPWTLSGRRN